MIRKVVYTFVLVLLSCESKEESGFYSSAIVESDLWKASPVVAGTIAGINVREGDSVSQGQLIAWVDSIPLSLKLLELQASKGELIANINAKEAEISSLIVMGDGIDRELARAMKLVAEGAITIQRRDDLETQSKVSQAKIAAARSGVGALKSKFAMIRAQEEILRDQISRCRIVSPANGRILTKYRNQGEASIPGRPIFEIGKTDTLWADFYIPQQDLALFKLGQKLKIRMDERGKDGNDAVWIPATLSWISHEAEFTPKGVQTREARNELVFRARVVAANKDGVLKRGMPVEIWE